MLSLLYLLVDCFQMTFQIRHHAIDPCVLLEVGLTLIMKLNTLDFKRVNIQKTMISICIRRQYICV